MLAVSGETRSALAPDVPTVAESGYPSYKVLTWNGLVAPAGTPPDVIEKIANEIAKAVKDQKFKTQLVQYAVHPFGSTPADYKAMLSTDIAIWAEAVNVAGLKQN